MTRRAALAVVVLVACLGTSTAKARGDQPAPTARAWLVENPVTGEVLAEHDAGRRVPIASITKLMTVLVALQHLKLTDVVRVDPRAAAVGQESIYLRAGQEISVADLVKGAMIQSANDAADALALATASSFPSFAELMNEKAGELGLTDSHFVRPDGLDAPGEYSSARDVTTLAIAAMKIPAIRSAVDEIDDRIEGGAVGLHTWDDLLGVMPGIFGVKTGHTSDAGWNQVSAIRGDGTTIYATILGSPSRSRRNSDLQTLLTYGLAQYREVDAVSAGTDYADVQLPYGKAQLALVAGSPFRTVARVGKPIVARVVAPVALSLPVQRGQVLGHVEIWSGGRLIGRRPLIASRSVSAPGLTSRIGWYATRTVHHLAGLVT